MQASAETHPATTNLDLALAARDGDVSNTSQNEYTGSA